MSWISWPKSKLFLYKENCLSTPKGGIKLIWPRATPSVIKVTIFIWTMQTSEQRHHNFRQTWWERTGLGLKQPPLSCAGSWNNGCLGHFRTVPIWFPGSLWNSNSLHLYIGSVLLQWDIVSFSQTALHSSLELGRRHGSLNSRRSFQQPFLLWLSCQMSCGGFWWLLKCPTPHAWLPIK